MNTRRVVSFHFFTNSEARSMALVAMGEVQSRETTVPVLH